MSAGTEIKIDNDIEELLKQAEKATPRYILILLNDDFHSFQEVIEQLIKAVQCSVSQAVQIMLAAHHTGRAVAKIDSLEGCQRSVRILEQINLGTDIIPDD
jgi:ATP-dependent Clp protease adapter protein ClpS